MSNESLEEFIFRYSKGQPFNEETKIESELLIKGQDAIIFINEYSREFNVDISDFDLDKYFNSINNTLSESYLTVGDLEKASFVGELNDKVINSNEYIESFRPRFSTKNIILGSITIIGITILLCFVAIYF